MQPKTLSSYEKMISEATDASDNLLPILERIMREDVFHSTLDWQSAREFNEGAQEAHQIYLGNRDFYDAQQAVFSASWQVHLARMELETARQGGSVDSIMMAENSLKSVESAERLAGQAFDKYLSPSCRTY